MDKLLSQLLRKWYLLPVYGVVWSSWQISIDELAELARERIPEGGVLMYTILHPQLIMPIILVITGFILFMYSKRTISKNDELLADIKDDLINLDTKERALANKKENQDLPDDVKNRIKQDYYQIFGSIKDFLTNMVENIFVKRDLDWMVNFYQKAADILDKNNVGLKSELAVNDDYLLLESGLTKKRAKLKLTRKKKAIVQKNINRIRTLTFGANSAIVMRGILKSVSNEPTQIVLTLETVEAAMRDLMPKMLDDIEIGWKAVIHLDKQQQSLLDSLLKGLERV